VAEITVVAHVTGIIVHQVIVVGREHRSFGAGGRLVKSPVAIIAAVSISTVRLGCVVPDHCHDQAGGQTQQDLANVSLGALTLFHNYGCLLLKR
jgi:hypothetical protein